MTITTQPTNALQEFEPEVWEQASIHKIIARAMARPDAATFKFDAEMVKNSKPLWDWAEYLVDHYVGPFTLMVEFRTKQRLGRQLSENQLKVALNTLLAVWRRSLKTAQVSAAADPIFDASVDFAQVGTETPAAVRTYPTTAELSPKVLVQQIPTDGTYTYVSGSGDYRVVRFNTPQTKDHQPGKYTWVSYQYGPDNDTEFAGCARITNLELSMWKRAHLKGDCKVPLTEAQQADLVEAIVFICSLDKDDLLRSGEAYALRSGNCFRCGRTLTVPSSISAGLGPICAKAFGL